MYSKEEREKAVKLYIKYNKGAADVIHELGYPDRNPLAKWDKTFKETGALWEKFKRAPKYSPEQKTAKRAPKNKKTAHRTVF